MNNPGLKIFHYIIGGLSSLLACFPLIHVTFGLLIVSGQFGDLVEIPIAPSDLPSPDLEGPANFGPPSQGFPPMSPLAFPPAQFGWLFVIMGGFFFVLGQTFSAFVLVSGRFIGQTKNRLFSFVIACLLCMFIPFGTVLGVFTIIVLSRDSVKELYASKKQLAG